jgi:uncharacterized protein YbaR (Trm112 family)
MRIRVPEPVTFDMHGPYLAVTVVCPVCQGPNLLTHLETYSSPVKPVRICRHMRAYGTDDEGAGFFEFEDNIG